MGRGQAVQRASGREREGEGERRAREGGGGEGEGEGEGKRERVQEGGQEGKGKGGRAREGGQAMHNCGEGHGIHGLVEEVGVEEEEEDVVVVVEEGVAEGAEGVAEGAEGVAEEGGGLLKGLQITPMLSSWSGMSLKGMFLNQLSLGRLWMQTACGLPTTGQGTSSKISIPPMLLEGSDSGSLKGSTGSSTWPGRRVGMIIWSWWIFAMEQMIWLTSLMMLICEVPGYSPNTLTILFHCFVQGFKGDHTQNPEWEDFYEEDGEQYEVVGITGHCWCPGPTPNSSILHYSVVWGDGEGNATDPDDEDEHEEENELAAWICAWQAGSPEASSGLGWYWLVSHEELKLKSAALIYTYWAKKSGVQAVDCPPEAKEIMKLNKNMLFREGKIGNGVSNAFSTLISLGPPQAWFKKLTVTKEEVDSMEGILCIKCCKDQGMVHAPSHHAHCVDVILQEDCTTWGTPGQEYQEACGLGELQGHIKAHVPILCPVWEEIPHSHCGGCALQRGGQEAPVQQGEQVPLVCCLGRHNPQSHL
ncbi:hypothetical protein DACRYDRAFT_16830 [Dacryopinax primogenitus]|uniref:Uncharacterized protein n=1 Tax=Dacryopinax primogenitus (strain DJM 731) TaxID=1858805 RepID=M5FVI0_DACPD|nr:uncharacterized protein DACRYDRAFT_16830 [Dacryopinax primogenitus]EJU00304.1 hypothetical protein DACRYDRAFT_16830 [Dacryopinax primogenitus]